jgi:hypothetical protein
MAWGHGATLTHLPLRSHMPSSHPAASWLLADPGKRCRYDTPALTHRWPVVRPPPWPLGGDDHSANASQRGSIRPAAHDVVYLHCCKFVAYVAVTVMIGWVASGY